MSNKSKASKSICDHLKKISRPEILQGLVNNLDGYKKADITKALESLVENGRVIEKTYGKTKIYYLNQKELKKDKDNLNNDQLDQQIIDGREALKTIENQIKEKETELNLYKGKLTKSELVEENKRLKSRLDEVTNELKKTETQKTEKENKKATKNYDYETVSKECRKRKRITKDIIDQLEEYSSKSKKKLLDDIGIEFYK